MVSFPVSVTGFVYKVYIYTLSPCEKLILHHYLQNCHVHTDAFPAAAHTLVAYLSQKPSRVFSVPSKRSRFLTDSKPPEEKFQKGRLKQDESGSAAAAFSLPRGSLIDSAAVCCPGRSAQLTAGGGGGGGGGWVGAHGALQGCEASQ